MKEIDIQLATLELMADQEDQLSILYSVFSDKFPGHQDFWQIISREEISHASWIRLLSEKVKTGQVFFGKGRFKSSVLEKTLGFIRSKIAEARAEDFTLIKAVCLAYDIELSLLERKYFQVFETDDADIKNTLDKLRVATEMHLERVKDFWQELRLEFGIEQPTIEDYLGSLKISTN